MEAAYETMVRGLRDRVFEQTSTDKNWEVCRDKWMERGAYEWLRMQDVKLQQRRVK